MRSLSSSQLQLSHRRLSHRRLSHRRLSHLGFSHLALALLSTTAMAAAQAIRQDVEQLLARAHEGIFSTAPEAEVASQQAIQLVEHTRMHDLHARALTVHGRILLEKGQLRDARDHIEQAIGICDSHLDEHAMGSAHLVFGFWFARHGEFGRCKQHAGVARSQLGERATRRQLAEIALLEAIAALARGAHQDGTPLLYEALEISNEHGIPDVAAQVHLRLATIAEMQHSVPDHARHVEIASQLVEQNDYGQLAPAVKMSFAMLAAHAKKSKRIRHEKVDTAVQVAKATGNPRWLAQADRWRGIAARWIDQDLVSAQTHLRTGIEKATAADDLYCFGHLVADLAFALFETDKPEAAIELIENHEEQLTRTGDRRLRVQMLRTYSQALAAVGRHEEAYAAAWEVADTVRWLATNESTSRIMEHEYETQLNTRRQQFRQATIFWVSICTLALGAAIWLLRMHTLQRRATREQVALNSKLESALSQVQELRGLLPICAQCKSIRDDEGYWHRIESYLTSNSKASLSHGICPGCADDLYPGLLPTMENQVKGDSEAG